MTVFATSGMVQWQTTAGDLGNQVVTLRATDPYGAFADQTFTVQVTDTANRPPRFTTTAPTDASVGQRDLYPSAAIDPDDDDLTYSVLSGPDGLSVDPGTGRVLWTPRTQDSGQTFDVILKVNDGNGGSVNSHSLSVCFMIRTTATRSSSVIRSPNWTWSPSPPRG